MKGLSKDKFFFFSENINELKILPNSLEHAYLALLNDDLQSAYVIFSKLDSPRSKWGEVITPMLIDGHLKMYPTYFQIRNFLEIDLDFLLKNNKIPYVEQILGALDLFSSINQEVYKYAARVMYANKLHSACAKYMEQSKKINYNDPELHFMLAKFNFESCKFEEALFYINECLNLLPSYYPALILKEKIEELLN